jgi:hypothetical protein
VVEQDAVGGVHPVAFTVVDGDPVAEDLGHSVGRAGMERRPLRLRGLLDETVHLGAARLIDAGGKLQLAHGVQDAKDAEGGDARRVLGHVEGDLHVALRGQVVDLVGSDRLQGADEAVLVYEVAVMQLEALTDVVDAPGVEGAAPTDEAVDLVSLLEEQLGQVAAVLARDSRDECLARAHTDLPALRRKGPILRWGAERT